MTTGSDASLQRIKSDIQSIIWCTDDTVQLLEGLLGIRDVSSISKPAPKAQPVRSRPALKELKQPKAKQSRSTQPLSDIEKGRYATEVINVSLKALTEAIRTHGVDKARSKATNQTAKSSRESRLPTTHDGIRRVATCTRIAFATLDAVRSARCVDKEDRRVEAGLSAFVGKLLALGLADLAIVELGNLMHRLNQSDSTRPGSLCSKSTDLANLLTVSGHPQDKQCLNIVISSQLHCLKLMAYSDGKHSRAAVKKLQINEVCGPYDLIAHGLENNFLTNIEASKSFRALSYCLSTFRHHGQDSSSAFASTTLQMQVLGLHYLVQSDILLGQQTDFANDVLTPLGKYIRLFLQAPAQAGKSTYMAISAIVMELVANCSKVLEASECNDKILFQITSVRSALGLLAHKCTHAPESLRHFRDVTEALERPGLAKVDKILSLSSLCSEATESSIDVMVLEKPMSCLARELQCDFDASIQQLDEVLIAVASLRRKAMERLRADLITSDDGIILRVAKAIGMYFDVLSSIVDFVLRYTKGDLELDTADDIDRQRQRASMVNRIARPTIDSVLMFIRTSNAMSHERRLALFRSLKQCTQVVRRLDEAVSEGILPALDDRLSEIHSKLSDQLLALHLNPTNQSLSPSCVNELLRYSVDVLKSRPIQEKLRSRYTDKISKLIRVHEGQTGSNEIMYGLELLVQHCEETGSLDRAISKAMRPCEPQTRDDIGDTSILHRTASVFVRLQVQIQPKTLPELFSMYVDIKDLNKLGHLAECQMSSSIDCLRNGVDTQGDMVAAPSQLLHTYYPASRRPISRLRVITWVLQVAQFWPEVTNPELVASCRQELLQFKLEQPAEDAGLIDQAPLLLSLSQISLAWSSDKMNVDLVRSALSTWKRVLQGSISSTSLHSIDLPLAWMQMVSLAEYLQAHCFTDEHETTLAILKFLCKRYCFKTTEDMSTLTISCAKSKLSTGQVYEAQSLILSLEHAPASCAEGPASPQIETVKAAIAVRQGDIDSATAHLDAAANAVTKRSLSHTNASYNSSPRVITTLITAAILSVHADYHETFGAAARALLFARAATKAAHTAWRSLLRKSKLTQILSQEAGKSGSTVTTLSSDVGRLEPSLVMELSRVSFSGVLACAVELIENFSGLSKRLADAGLIQEARQYLRQAERLAETLGLEERLRKLELVSASFSAKEGSYEASVNALLKIINDSKASDVLRTEAELELCNTLYLSGDIEEARRRMSEIQMVVSPAATAGNANIGDAMNDLENGIKGLNPSRARSVAGRHKKSAPSVVQISRVESSQLTAHSAIPVNEQHQSLVRQRHLLHISIALADDDPAELLPLLNSPDVFFTAPKDKVLQAVLHSKIWLREALGELALDPIFNSIGDAPLSYPAGMERSVPSASVIEPSKPASRQRKAAAKPKAPVKTGSVGAENATMPNKSLVAFQKATIGLKETVGLARAGGDTSLIHELAYDLTRASMFVAAAQKMDKKQLPYELAAALETGRSAAWERQTSVALSESMVSSTDDMSLLKIDLENLSFSGSNKSSSDSFQADYVDIIPQSWTAISLSLSSDHRELQVSRLRQGSTPFLLSLPLGRNFDGAEEEELSFGMAKAELTDIVDLANYSTHDSSDMTRKGAKTEWWKTRNALDERLKNLLENMDRTWLGGFSGIFNQRSTAPGSFRAFRDCFLKVLNHHLPSRTTRAASKGTTFVDLNDQVLELFTCLRRPNHDGDLDEPLLDLLAFVVDILQFNGERNAFDEIDFDAMVLDLMDALGQYHQAAERELSQEPKESHVVLILDKHLHCFPWESMPCMQGVSVSRLPTLEMLRERIIAQRQGADWTAEEDSMVIDPSDGACILNPGSDLLHTERTFSEPLSKLPESWTRVIRRAPEESELAHQLKTRSLYVYLGHGSGGQYIRSRTVRKLDRCAVSLLLGCSSATVTEAGQYESYGTPLTYLQGGAPAVVGTLWDVTDKDIDKFSMKMLQRWGLFQDEAEAKKGGSKKEAPKASRGRKKAAVLEIVQRETRVGLDTAVSEAREECLMRYLNGAAPVVYGVPVVLR